MASQMLDRPTIHIATPRIGLVARLRRSLLISLAVVGIVFLSYLIGAAAIDITSTDQTRGGYEPPYTEFTGTPIQADQVALEGDQLIIRGRVLDSEISCRTGMWVFDIVGFDIPYRTVSERALVVHRPQEFCRAAGFDTTQWDGGR
jgi:hypothetical protein